MGKTSYHNNTFFNLFLEVKLYYKAQNTTFLFIFSVFLFSLWCHTTVAIYTTSDLLKHFGAGPSFTIYKTTQPI